MQTCKLFTCSFTLLVIITLLSGGTRGGEGGQGEEGRDTSR